MAFKRINLFKVQTLLIECIDDWNLVLDENKSVDIIFFDFHKAFDKINIDILLQKLNLAGLRAKFSRVNLAGFYRPRSLATLPVSSAPAHSFCYHCGRHCRSLITIWRAIFHLSSPSSFELPTVHTGSPASSTYLHLFPVSSLLTH
jgi:hypothetical protein